MPENFYTILTEIGRGKLANAIPLQQPVNLATVKVGDSGGAYRNPTDDDESVVGEVWSGPINALYVDPDNPNYIIVEAVITAEIGPFFVREVGVFDQAGDMIGIGKFPETYKPDLPAGAGKDLYIRIILEVVNTAAVTLKLNPAIVLATRQYADALMGTAAGIRRITESGNVLTNDITLLVDATAGDIDLALLTAVGSARGIRIKRVDATSNRVRLLPQGGQTIEWETEQALVRRGEAYHYVPDGVGNWMEMAGKPATETKVITFADSPYAVKPSDGTLLVDCTDGSVAIQFLDASVGGAKRLTVKKTDVTENAVQCTPAAGQEVEGEAGSYDSVMPGEFMSFVPDAAAAWHRVG